jgi:predicted membrane protein
LSTDDKFDPDKFREDLRDRIHEDIRSRLRTSRPGGMQVHLGDRTGGMWAGVVLVLIGTTILLDHLGIISVDRVWRFWPLILIVAGGARFIENRCNRLFSALLMVVGALLLLGNLGYLRFTWAEVWPLILIAAGVSMIWGRSLTNRIQAPAARTEGTETAGKTSDPNAVNATALFGGVERRITINNFKSGVVSATFGGIELDFRGADIEGEEAVLYIEAIFGGIELVVPERWIVVYEGQSIFGGYNDETRQPLPDLPGTPARKRLILRGQALFGGITIKN